MSRLPVKLLDILFVLSALLGPAASYSVVYLFHLILGLKMAETFTATVLGQGPRVPRPLYWDCFFLVYFLSWYVYSIAWALNSANALRYCAYVAIAVITVLYCVKVFSSRDRLAFGAKLVLGVTALQVVLAALEALRVIRLPFSPYSPYLTVFGRLPSDIHLLSDAAANYVLSMPTGFMGNPNNISAFLILLLPMFLFLKRPWMRVAGAVAVFYIIFMAGARSALLGYALVLLAAAMVYTTNRVRMLTFAGVLVAGLLMFTLGGPMKDSPFARVAEVADIMGGLVEMVSDIATGSASSSGSVGVRAQLILNGFEALAHSNGLGVGASGHLSVQENSTVDLGDITSMHNFWIELLVDGGVLFGLAFFAWYVSLIGRLWHMGRYSRDPLLQYLGKSLSIGFVGFILGAVGPSSVIYMLPMWLVIGLALAAINLEAQRREAEGAGVAVAAGVAA